MTGRTSAGNELFGTLRRLARAAIVFETDTSGMGLRHSEVLSEFRIIVNDRRIYDGRAVIRGLVDAGVTITCEAGLEEGWLDLGVGEEPSQTDRMQGFQQVLRQWEQFYRVSPKFKVVVSDLQMFLTELRLWTEQVEVSLQSDGTRDRQVREKEWGQEISRLAHPALDGLFERFETIAGDIPEEDRPAYQHFIRRQLHPDLLTSPFACRVVRKPLGYAGDYEMVNMILRDPHEGPSLFGKVLNRWFIKQPPAEAHRNRVDYLARVLGEETIRAMQLQRPLRVLNFGCGPAEEMQHFFAHCEAANHAQFTLLDFNEETLEYSRKVLEAARARHRRTSSMRFVKKSVVQLIKGGAKESDWPDRPYDLVYCAGLFDYLQDSVCKRVMNVFYDLVAPGGLLLVTNVDPSNPIRHWLGSVLEWHLIYRDARQMRALCPDQADAAELRVQSDITGVNVFLEVRKPGA